MKKQKLNAKLNLNKQKVSSLEASKIVGGATIIFGDCLTSWDYECFYSLGKQDMINAQL